MNIFIDRFDNLDKCSFNVQVDDFDSKMADMEAVLQAELQLIKHQHLELQVI